MSIIRWPHIHQENGIVRKMLKQQTGFWVISPSMFRVYPEIVEQEHFVVHTADFATLFQLQLSLLQKQPKEIFAIGGGKTLDLAKLAVRLGTLEEMSFMELQKRKWISKEHDHSLNIPLTMIPTTAGSGSEVSEIAVLTVMGHKTPLHHESLLPDKVVADTEVFFQSPLRVIWNGIWDSLAHALESALSPLATSFSQRISYESLRSSIRLINVLKESSQFSEAEMMDAQYSSLLAGKAQSVASVGLAHALAHQAESELQWHGEACARVLPKVIALNAEKAPDKYEELARKVGMDNYSQFARWIEEKVRLTVGEFIPVAASQEERDELVKRIMKDPCYRTNPAYISKAELTEWLERWYYE